MLNIGVVELSDGRKIRVVAEHEGKITVTLVFPEVPQGAERPFDWATFEYKLRPEHVFQAEQLRAFEEHASHDDKLMNPECEHCLMTIPSSGR